jgi:PIN domain nuclease of toxin-antitoxin system
MSIKAGSGKLKTVDNIAEKLLLTSFSILPIEPRHAEAVRTLPHHHRDPFDRMLIAQAMAEKLSLLTVDRHFTLYDVTIV